MVSKDEVKMGKSGQYRYNRKEEKEEVR